MENETDVIRQQMVDTRTALSEKLEALQEQVLSTVEGTTKTVTDTVQTVQAAVQDTVNTVSGTVQDTVDTVKKTFDVSEQVDKHPWLMVGGAVAAGYLVGRLTGGASFGTALAAVSAHPTGNGYAASQPSGPGWMDTVAGPALKQVQEMALGALAGVAADLLMRHAPDTLKQPLDELVNNVATALNTKPLRGLLDGQSNRTTV